MARGPEGTGTQTGSGVGQSIFFRAERRRLGMRSAAKRVEQSLGYGYLSKMEWFSLRPQLVRVSGY
jgi:hypothetical protein